MGVGAECVGHVGCVVCVGYVGCVVYVKNILTIRFGGEKNRTLEC